MTAHRLIERWEAPQGYRLASVIRHDLRVASRLPRRGSAAGRSRPAVAASPRKGLSTGARARARGHRGVDILPSGPLPARAAQVSSHRPHSTARRALPQTAREGGAPSFRCARPHRRLRKPGCPPSCRFCEPHELGLPEQYRGSGGPSTTHAVVSSEAATAVREAVDWLRTVDRFIDKPSGPAAPRHEGGVRMSRSASRRDKRLRFVGLPSATGFPRLAGSRERVGRANHRQSVSGHQGNDLSDVAHRA